VVAAFKFTAVRGRIEADGAAVIVTSVHYLFVVAGQDSFLSRRLLRFCLLVEVLGRGRSRLPMYTRVPHFLGVNAPKGARQ
jgi:hypothetical protein